MSTYTGADTMCPGYQDLEHMQRASRWGVSSIVGCGLASVLFLAPIPAVAQLARSPVAAQDVSLVDAVRSGDRETITRLLESGLSASSAEPDGTAALHWASQQDDLSTVKLLLAFGAEVDARNRYGVTPLMLAVTNGSPLVVEALIDAGASVDGVTSSGDTLLMVAARTGRVDVVEQLLAAGAAVDAKESWRGQTALMWAAAEGNVETIQALVRAGADLEARSEGQLTALLFAVREGRPDAVAALVAVGADVNAPARDGTAPACAGRDQRPLRHRWPAARSGRRSQRFRPARVCAPLTVLGPEARLGTSASADRRPRQPGAGPNAARERRRSQRLD